MMLNAFVEKRMMTVALIHLLRTSQHEMMTFLFKKEIVKMIFNSIRGRRLEVS
jgi:hypothetical protein